MWEYANLPWTALFIASISISIRTSTCNMTHVKSGPEKQWNIY